MKLCIGSASCVIENRLEREESELERRLLRPRSAANQVDDKRRSAAPTPAISAASSTGPPAEATTVTAAVTAAASGGGALASTCPVSVSTADKNRTFMANKSGSAHAVTIHREDLPLSHTWHGGRPTVTVGGSDQIDRSGGGGVGLGSRSSLRGPSRMWGGAKGSRELDAGSVTPTGTDAANAGTGLTGTPTKAVKFLIGRKKTNSIDGSPVGRRSTTSDRQSLDTSQDPGVTAASKSGHENGKGANEEAADAQGSVMNVNVQARLWADYFNNVLRCWEALLDPFR